MIGSGLARDGSQMPLRPTSKADLAAHLAALGVRRGTDLIVHSRLVSFGLIEGGAPTVYAALRDAVGDQATIAVPAYTVSFASRDSEGRVFDPAETPSEMVGALSEYVRLLPDAVRSICPTHSHAAVGPKARMLDRDSAISFGPGSDFDLFLREGFSTLYFGCSFKEAATFAFHVEAMFGAVPYREWVELPCQLKRHGTIEQVVCRYYRRASLDAHEDLTVVETALERTGKMTPIPCLFGASRLVRLADFYDCLLGMLRANPSALLVAN